MFISNFYNIISPPPLPARLLRTFEYVFSVTRQLNRFETILRCKTIIAVTENKNPPFFPRGSLEGAKIVNVLGI